MRYAITAISRKGGRATANTVCTFLRQCKTDFDGLTHHSRELSKKQRVTVESLHKIEDGELSPNIHIAIGQNEKMHGIVAYAVAIRCYEFDLPHERLDDIVSRMLDASLAGEPRGKQGDYTEFGYY